MRKRQANIKTQFDRAPVIAFLAHVDTATGFNASGVKPIVHRAYAGGAIVLPDDPVQVFSPQNSPYLATRVGDDIGTASGTTRLKFRPPADSSLPGVASSRRKPYDATV